MSSVLETDKSSASDSLPLIQRISYGSLDVAGNLLYCFGSTTFSISTLTWRA